jgi:hypothetical protein
MALYPLPVRPSIDRRQAANLEWQPTVAISARSGSARGRATRLTCPDKRGGLASTGEEAFLQELAYLREPVEHLLECRIVAVREQKATLIVEVRFESRA